eukprot:Nk52_evm28s485 gene=Nk52_evmTU28s485
MVNETKGASSRRSSSRSVLTADGQLNFRALERELSQAVAADKLYKLRNDAKIRAMEARVDYEQFEGLWKTAHLKSLTSKEIYTPEPLKTPWNPSTSSQASPASVWGPAGGSTASGETGKEESTILHDDAVYDYGKLPQSSLAFERDWRKLMKKLAVTSIYDDNSCMEEDKKSLMVLFGFLMAFPDHEMRKLLVGGSSGDISAVVLSQIFNVLARVIEACDGETKEDKEELGEDKEKNENGFKTQERLDRMVNILLWLTQGNRFGLTVAFLSKKDKGAIKAVFDGASAWESETKKTPRGADKKEDINKLRQLYKC